MSTELTQPSKENVAESSVNQAFMVNEGKLVLSEVTQSPKDFAGFTVLTELLLVNIGNLFRISVYRAGSANEGFY